MKTIINRVSYIKEVVVVHIILVKPSVMQKLDVMKKIIQLNTFEATSTTVFNGLSCQMLQKC